jgi:hypothetical protein
MAAAGVQSGHEEIKMTGIELAALIIVGSGVGGMGWWIIRRRHQLFARRTQSHWVYEGRIVRYGPVDAVWLGQRPKKMFNPGRWGVFGITGDQVVFASPNGRADFQVALANVRQIHLPTVSVWVGKTAARYRALAVHYEDGGEWWVAILTLGSATQEAAQTLARLCDLPVIGAEAARSDFGPVKAARLTQDIYGEWQADQRGVLYLAADRLLFDWRDAILLSQVERLDVLPSMSRRPFAADLLRVEYVTPVGDHAVCGFAVRRAGQWARAIAHHRDQPLPVWTGRKKK